MPSPLEWIRHVEYLAHLDDTQRDTIEPMPVVAGQTICVANEVADAAYVIASGAVQIIIHRIDGAEVVTARLEPGQYFGEQAFLSTTRRRNATVRAAEDGVLLRVPGALVRERLEQHAPASAALRAHGEEQQRRNFARLSALFRHLPIEAFQALHFEERRYAPGQTVFTEGEVGDRVFLILEGQVGIHKTQDGLLTLVATLDAGRCFGETAVAANSRRSATVQAHTTLRTLSIDAASFSALHGSSPAMQQYLTTLDRIYQSPRLGVVAQGSGRLMDEDAVTCAYNLPDGSTVIAARTIDGHVFSMRRGGASLDGGERVRFERPAEGVTVELVLDQDRLCSMTVVGDWEDLGSACDLILRGDPFDRWRATVFSSTGRLQLESTPAFGGSEDVVCHCMGITLAVIRDAIVAGATDAEDIATKTGCGSVCGSCRPQLRALTGTAAWTPVRVQETIVHAPEIRAFRFAPWTGGLQEARPGQHIVVEGLIDGAWIRRAYTLTSPPSEQRYREITVKREHHGIFSSWLFREAGDQQLLRISDAQGDVIAADRDTPIVYFVAGIGVTPALVMCRHEAAIGGSRPLVVDYSVRERRDAVALDELRGYATSRPVQFTLRVSSETGRVTATEVECIAAQHPDATFIVCGPSSFEQAISALLRHAGVDSGRVRVERFTAAGAVVPVLAPGDGPRRPSIPPTTVVALPYTPITDGTQPGVFAEAKAFLTQLFHEKGVLEALPARLDAVATAIARTGTYVHTYDELAYGAKMAWRNSPGCIGRVFWPALQVRDLRHLHTEEEVFRALMEHLRLATNGGRIRPIISIFSRDGVTIWNEQMVRYAAYRQPGGTIIGDPASLAFTEQVMALGWPGGARTPFDVLPIVVQIDDRPPQWFDVPPQEVLEVPISHPTFRWWEELGLKWMALPALSEHGMDLGGIRYGATPFTGWYTGPEIGSRNFGDRSRYNLFPVFAQKMGLDMSSARTLWRDRAMLESNVAVLHSFAQAGVTLLDHHTITRKFMDHVTAERGHGRDVHASPMASMLTLCGAVTPDYPIEWPVGQYKPLLFKRPTPY